MTVRGEIAPSPCEPARVQERRHLACEVERPLYYPGAKKEYRNEFWFSNPRLQQKCS
jgi:hypothetical protein